MTDINSLKKTIINRISDAVTTVKDVADYEKTGFRGFPAVTVTCSGNENDYYTTAQNMRNFAFLIRVYYQIGKDINNDPAKEKAEQIVSNAVSDIIDAFDDFVSFNNNADYLKASPSVWGYAELEVGWVRTAEIRLEVNKLYTTS